MRDPHAPRPMPDRSVFMRRIAVAAGLMLIVSASVAVTARDAGISWDESIYIGFALRYVEWFSHLSGEAFSQDIVTRFWLNGQVHPPLAKLWIAFSMIAFGTVDLISAARIGAGLLFGLTAAMVYMWTANRRGDATGLMAAAAFVLMPRVFAHGHFANLEMPMVCLWVAVIFAFERGLHHRGWSVLCGALFGMALLTKINAVFLPLVLFPWGFLYHGRRAWRNTVCMVAMGPILFLAGWPAMWFAPIRGPWAYLTDKATRAVIPTFYLGKVYGETGAPFHYPFVMLMATTPALVLAPAAIRVVSILRVLRTRWREAEHGMLVLLSCLVPIMVLALPIVPKYDGARLMLTAMPFLAILSAEGAKSIWDALSNPLASPRCVAWVCGIIAGAWLALPVISFHPFQLGYYGELVGGPWGAARMGFETTYWNETLNADALDWLDKHVPPNGRVALVAVGSMVWQYYPALGEVREDIRLTDFERGDWDALVIVPRQGMLSEPVREFMSSREPVWVRRLGPFNAPPVCLIYTRP